MGPVSGTGERTPGPRPFDGRGRSLPGADGRTTAGRRSAGPAGPADSVSLLEFAEAFGGPGASGDDDRVVRLHDGFGGVA
ncbi:hypothetical protein GCM10010231_05530 [Streptomyces sindenensis]|nr:hypothetical protein GCM10010231_05530 [Streptomyces sindenensis]